MSGPTSKATLKGTAETRPQGVALPRHLAALVNPDVAAARLSVIQKRHLERAGDSVYRRRYVNTIVNHLLGEMNDG